MSKFGLVLAQIFKSSSAVFVFKFAVRYLYKYNAALFLTILSLYAGLFIIFCIFTI
ncbi:hypothetical protein CSG_2360 [Campylobacter fetus subsp. venerealis str. 84-112]|uniref:Uncharacterized protein n=1 Tax=Campylobacter fetus subsp. fetus (strain 82-40) TaxID=360106 RepID=A0RNJ5_CAMFF|nr:hypothetical protein CFF8240_0589 [Campylobacter fetus subsp. fetus 82-40]CDF64156.1 hypothetical protein CSG_2360 [Campylobacter fetus subsp. venerealis str. 84-112]